MGSENLRLATRTRGALLCAVRAFLFWKLQAYVRLLTFDRRHHTPCWCSAKTFMHTEVEILRSPSRSCLPSPYASESRSIRGATAPSSKPVRSVQRVICDPATPRLPPLRPQPPFVWNVILRQSDSRRRIPRGPGTRKHAPSGPCRRRRW